VLGREDEVALVLAVLVATTMTGRPAAMSRRPVDVRERHERPPASSRRYLAMMSTSRFTGSPTGLAAEDGQLERGGSGRRERVVVTAMTVRETPSTVIEPFSTTYRASSGGSEKRSTSHSSRAHGDDPADAVHVPLDQVPAEAVPTVGPVPG